MAETKITKLGTGITSPRPSNTIIREKVKGQGHRVKSAKRRSSGRHELCTPSSASLSHWLRPTTNNFYELLPV